MLKTAKKFAELKPKSSEARPCLALNEAEDVEADV